ncbi:MAG TPA: hypothetical protein DEW10_02755 [Bifidobacterium sp.]|nr:hypothetical protein [Bifidobacterium sp.]
MSKDANENPLPESVDVTQVVTIRDYLEQVHHPASDIDGDAMRFGQKVFEAYKRYHQGRKPYTVRFHPNGPVKVYLPSDMPILHKTYAAWKEQQRRRQSVVKDVSDAD